MVRGLERDANAGMKQRTARSFAYEWERFGGLRPEWRRNFSDYMQPHDPGFLRGKTVLDVGTGSGRHSAEAARHGARVVAVDLGASIDVARRNLPADVLTVQADAENLPFDLGSFDFVMSLGVLHHLPDPPRALRGIAKFTAPGGRTHVYLYWQPERRGHRVILRGVTALRRLTVRLPHPVLHVLCVPLGAVLFATVVLPGRLLRKAARTTWIADRLPLGTYLDYPVGVLINDTFDRFSAPIEHRYTADEVRDLLASAGLEDIQVLPNYGWIGDGRMPAQP
jgi:2-polyprenyl-3-methyl-5-hydroxy-6-metoxy-1,4-benzoquinol methylase